MARLPAPGSDANNWGSLLNDYLQQSLADDGTLVTDGTNTYTGLANTNLATNGHPGLVQLTNDLGNTAASPKVVGLQGRSVDSASPSDGDALIWDAGTSKWTPEAPPTGGGGGLTDLDGGSSSSTYGGITAIDGGSSS